MVANHWQLAFNGNEPSYRFTLHVTFFVTKGMAIFESGEDKEEHFRDKERRKMQKNCDDRSLSQPIVKTRPEYE